MFKLRGGIISALVVVGLLALPTTAFAAPPSNDDFANAIVIDNRGRHWTDTTEATTAADDPQCNGSDTAKSIWYRYTAPDGVDMTFTGGVASDRSMVVGAYSGERGSLEELSCGPATNWENTLTLTVPAGETVHFMVADTAVPGLGGGAAFYFRATPPPVDVDLTITKTGLIDTASGEAVVRGELECSRDSRIRVYGYVRQKQGNKTVGGSFSDRVRCDEGDVELWIARATPYRGSFARGAAAAEADWRDLDGSDSNGNVDPTIYLKPCSMIGSPRSDRIQGTHRDETICALSGNDKILGRAGNDRLVGGPGRDVLNGGEGNDVLTGGPGVGRNILDGGPGHDVCKRASKADIVRNCEEVS